MFVDISNFIGSSNTISVLMHYIELVGRSSSPFWGHNRIHASALHSFVPHFDFLWQPLVAIFLF